MITTREDVTAPVSEIEVNEVKFSKCEDTKKALIGKILEALNEKRDSYNGVITSIIYVIDSKDDYMKNLLVSNLIDSIVQQPMRFSGKVFIHKATTRLTSEKPLFVLDLFEGVVSRACELEDKIKEHKLLCIQIIAIKAIRKAEEAGGGRPTRLEQDKIEKICHRALSICDDTTKIDTLSLILESRSTTKSVEEKELRLFRVLFRDALSLQEPALRQIVIAQTNKLIKRIKDSLRVVIRDKKRYSDDDRFIMSQRYMQFLKWLTTFCFDSIYCNAYFGSFILTISTLKLIIQHITFTDENLPVEPLFSQRRCYDSVLSCLNDSFEENKTLALELLLSLPDNKQYIDESYLECFEKIAYKLVGSVNPAHSLTCQFVFKLIIGLNLKRPSSYTKNRLLLKHLDNLVTIVEHGIASTGENFLTALKNEPIYPKLTCIRALLAEVDPANLDTDRSEWISLSKRIVTASIEACKVVSAVVCNLNPETIGHLPMDIKPMDIDTLCKTLNVSMRITDKDVSTITSQMLLISGWKTIKECSLSLGTMCLRFWWSDGLIKNKKEKFKTPDCKSILDNSDVKDIIAFFIYYLKNLRHRGAFEQAYNGFFMVTQRIWPDHNLRGQLVETLDGIMSDFRNESVDDGKLECLKAYVTRRSAGLPFIVQAIVNSEPKHDSQTLRRVIDLLFEVLENDESESYQMIHCLNILKALIKEHHLGEKVLPYIDKTFAIAMRSFTSDNFSIRNCANMLLKATVDRTFGVNRLRDDIHRRNQLSFERFFTECPDLRQKMLNYLEDALNETKYLAAVHSVFVLLFRLRPSLNPEEEYSARKVIQPFIDPLLRLAYNCTDYKVRELAARLSVILDNYCTQSGLNEKIDLLDIEWTFKEKLLELRRSNQKITQPIKNQLHGQLSVIKFSVDYGDLHQYHYLKGIVPRIVEDSYLNKYNGFIDCSLKILLLDIVESFFKTDSTRSNQWLEELYCDMFETTTSELSDKDPNYENLVFKYLTIVPMCTYPRSNVENNLTYDMTALINYTVSVISSVPNRTCSMNLQASLLRYLRHLLFPGDDFVNHLMDKLDTDQIACHSSALDQLRLKAEIDTDREKLYNYCDHKALREYVRVTIDMKSLLSSSYIEFTPDSTGKFTSRRSNTHRAIELLALVCMLDFQQMQDFHFENETALDRLESVVKLIEDLPDCDVKCMALLYAGKFMVNELTGIIKGLKECSKRKIAVFEKLSATVDFLSDGDHCMTIRETCSEILSHNLKLIISQPKSLQVCLLNLLSSLIKLSQDEDYEVRLIGQRIISDLAIDATLPLGGSRLSRLIDLITTKLFDANQSDELSTCFDLMMRIIFNHSRNYSRDVNDEKERLFDKTKLNTFADHVATIQCSLHGLQSFLGNRLDLIDLNHLRFPANILDKFHVIDSSMNDEIGDYSWHLKKITNDDNSQDRKYQVDNNQVIDRLLNNISKSLEYFKSGYWNMLTDTDYTYHELLLYKQMAFLRFVLRCTKHKLRQEHLVEDIRMSLRSIVSESCTTTMLCKCLDLIS